MRHPRLPELLTTIDPAIYQAQEGRLRCRHCGVWEQRRGNLAHRATCEFEGSDAHAQEVVLPTIYDGPAKFGAGGRISTDWLAAARQVLAVEQDEAHKATLGAEVAEAEAKVAATPKLPGKVMEARFRGSCAICGRSIRAGETIHYHNKAAEHLACAEQAAAGEAAVAASGAQLVEYSDHVQPIEGKPVREPYQRPGQAERRWVVPLQIRSRYIREDGLSFGLDQDSGTLYSVKARLATADEIAAEEQRLSDERARYHAARERKARLDRLHDKILREGERPAGADPSGTDLTPGARYDDDRYYLDREAGLVWVEVYNGRDGDSWANNNARGGASIAACMAVTPELLAEVEALWPATKGNA